MFCTSLGVFRNFLTNELLSLFIIEIRIINLIWNNRKKNTDYEYRYAFFICFFVRVTIHCLSKSVHDKITGQSCQRVDNNL